MTHCLPSSIFHVTIIPHHVIRLKSAPHTFGTNTKKAVKK